LVHHSPDRVLSDGAHAAHEGFKLRVGLDARTRFDLLTDQLLQRLLMVDTATGANAANHTRHIRSFLKQVELNPRRFQGIGRSQ
jgi:hypothetical protein